MAAKRKPPDKGIGGLLDFLDTSGLGKLAKTAAAAKTPGAKSSRLLGPAAPTPRPPPKRSVPSSRPTLVATKPSLIKTTPAAIKLPPAPTFVTHPKELGGSALGVGLGKAAHVAHVVARSAVPIDEHGHLATPEAAHRVDALAKTVAVGLIGGTTWTAKEVYDRAAHNPNFGQGVDELKQRIHAHELQTGRPTTIDEAHQMAAGLGLDPGLSKQNVLNVGAAVGGIGSGLYHDPVGVAKDIGKLLVSVPVGTGLLVAAMSRPDLNTQQREAMLAQMPKAIRDDFTKRFGKGVSSGEAYGLAKKDPVMTALDLIPPVGGGPQWVRIAVLLRRGHGLAEAVRLARDPAVQRTLRYTERAPKGSGLDNVVTNVPTFWSSSVAFRNVVQRPYDAASRIAEAIPGVRRLPIAEGPRALRAQSKTIRRTKNRASAEAHAAFRDVQTFLNHRNALGQKVNEHYATTLAVLVQKPAGFTDAEWEQAVIQNLKDMRADPENMTLPGDTVTPAEQRIINRINRYDKRAEADRVRKKGLAVRRISDEQGRLSDTLSSINATRAKVRTDMRNTADDQNLPPEQRGVEVGRQQTQLHALDAQGKVIREKLESISVDQPPIESANRERLRQQMEALPYFQENPQAVQDALLVGDAAARHWARVKGENPAVWWDKREPITTPAEGIPEAAFAQTRTPSATDVPDPAALDAKAAEVFDRYGHVSGAMPPSVHDAAGWADKAHEVARLAKLGENHKDWYKQSGLAIRDRIGTNNWKEARQIAAAVAYLSRTDSVMANVGHAMRAFTSYKETKDAGLAGRYPNVANAKLNDIFAHNAWGGYKTNSFFRNILEEYDPVRFKKEFGSLDAVTPDFGDAGDEVTVDRWIVRAFGHADDNVGGKARYFAAREIIQHIADQLGWTPKEVQAAIWVAVKAESDAAKEAIKVADRNVTNKAKYDASVAKAAETGRGGPKKEWEPEKPKTAQDFLEGAGVHVGTSLDRISHQLRVNAEAAPGSTYAGFSEYASFSPAAQEEFANEIARGVYDYYRSLGVPHVPGEKGPGLYEPEGMPVETNPAFAVDISIGSAMRKGTAAKYGLERVPEWQRTEFDAVVAGQGRGTRQNAMPWLRPLIPEGKADKTATFVERANLSSDDMIALRDARGDADWQIAIGHGDGGVWFSMVKDAGMTPEDFQAKVATIVDRTFGKDAEAIDFAHEGGYVENDWKKGATDYEAKISNSRRPGEIRRASDQLSDHYESTRVRFTSHPDGPDGAARDARRNRLARGRRARTEPGVDPPAAGPLRNQTRRQDTLGATQLLNSATGQRVIWLTEHADFSTVVHELLGHATEEMADLHPEEFAAVEQVIGKPLAEWDVTDHEKFATWFERYLTEGHAPTPELVPVFDRAKQYMRVIYAQIRRMLGGRIPHATRDLFDHYLGGWDSDNATRIAVNMGHKDPSDSRWAGASAAAQQELATLQKRNRTRRYNRTIPGMMDELKRLEKQAEQRGAMNEEERDALTAQIVRTRAEIVLRSDRRVKNLDSKISDMEKALTRDPNNRRFSGALQSAKWMMDDRTRILKEVFGPEFNAIFDNREDLLANYLVQHGLISPDFEHGTGSYYPTKLDEGFWQHAMAKIPMTPASNRVIGQVSKAMVGVHHRNEMIRWQAGDWSADPMVLQLAHGRATAYQFMIEVKELLHGMGRPLTFDEEHGNFPEHGYLINLEGTPLSHDLKLQTRGVTNTTTANNLDDGLFGDNGALEASLKKYFENSVIDMKNLPPGFDLANPNLRYVSKAAVDKIFRPVSLNTGGKLWDAASTAARFALIYANVPGYMTANLAGNLVFLTMQQGLNWIPRTVVYGKMLANDAHFRARVAGEAGMLPAFSAITQGRNFAQVAGAGAKGFEKKWLAFESKVDEYPRMIAWMAEANKAGYYSKESMIRLLDGKNMKTVRDRERVAEYTNQHMIDFTYRVGDRERQTLGRLFFIWPYVRGATAMPFWYAKNYPARTALGAQLAQQQVAYQQAILGPLPPGRQDLYPLSRHGNTAEVIGTRYYNPTGPLADEAKLVQDTVASAFGRVPDNLSARLSSLLGVNIEGASTVFSGKDAYGRDQSLKSAVLDPYGIADSLVPFRRYVRAAFDERYVPRAFRKAEGQDFWGRFDYGVLRIMPHTVSVPWLNAAASSTAAKSTTQKIDDAVKVNMKHFHSIEGAGVHYPNSFRKQVAAKVIYSDRVYALEREQAAQAGFVPKQKEDGSWDFGYHADNYDQAMVAWTVMKKSLPEALAAHPSFAQSPNEFLAQHGAPPRSVKGLDLVSRYVQFFNDMTSHPPNEKGIHPRVGPTDFDQMYLDKQAEKKYMAQKKRGVYARSRG